MMFHHHLDQEVTFLSRVLMNKVFRAKGKWAFGFNYLRLERINQWQLAFALELICQHSQCHDGAISNLKYLVVLIND